MKLVALVTLLVLGTTYGAPTDQEHVSGPKGTEAAEERILDLSRKSRQLIGSAFGGYPYSNGFAGQGYGGYPSLYSNGIGGYAGFGGSPYYSNGYNNGYSNGLYGGGNGFYSSGLYSNGLGYNGNGFSPLNGYSSGLYVGAQQLYNDPYSPLGSRGLFPGSPFYRRPF